MRLRYFRVRNNPPLDDVAIAFHHETALGRNCAINFIVGVNGSGKSRLLQSLAEIFLRLADKEVPSYPFTLAYDLGEGTDRRTVCFHHEGGSISNASLRDFNRVLESADWENLHNRTEDLRMEPFHGHEMPSPASIGNWLPSVVLVYSSGVADSWEHLFAPLREVSEEETASALDNPDIEERPRGWDMAKEIEYRRREGQSQSGSPLSEATSDPQIPSRSLFVSAEELNLALCAVALDQAAKEFRDEMPDQQREKMFINRIEDALERGERMPGLRGILNAIDWLWPVTLTLRISWQKDRLDRWRKDWIKSEDAKKLWNLFQLANARLREPAGAESRMLAFDLRSAWPENPGATIADALMETLGSGEATPFEVFRRLRSWRREGILEDVSIILRKRNVADLLLYDWLSDGERAFLGRMALFHLLRGKQGQGKQDALILLDEPETHFNDVWKREIVDIIDDSLGNVTSSVVITTHSSIALTDVFDTEISLLEKDEEGGIDVAEEVMNSFGASPTEIMRGIFGAKDSVGQRAAQFLDIVLTVAAHPDDVEAVWRMTDGDAPTSDAFKRLWEFVSRLRHHYESEPRLMEVLRAVQRYAAEDMSEAEVSVSDALNVLQKRLGPGYYQFEFRRRLMALEERDSNAS